jgi:hypothetical protein
MKPFFAERQSAPASFKSSFEVTGGKNVGPFPSHTDTTMARGSKNDWANSSTRKLLVSELTSGRIPLRSCEGFMPRDVHRSRSEYQAIDYATFCSRLRYLRKSIELQKCTGCNDAVSLSQDRALYPKKARNVNGVLRWEGTDAAKLLKLDVSNGRHVGMFPRQLWATREEYKAFPKDVFASHLNQEKRTQKFHAYLASKSKSSLQA